MSHWSAVPSRGSFVVIEQPAQPRPTANAADISFVYGTLNQFVLNPLVIALSMVVRDVLRNRPPEVALTDRDHAVETLIPDRAHEALGVRIRIRRPIWRQHDANARLLGSRVHRRAPLRVAVTD